MESIKAIKNRIQSIISTRQITQSMRLVSTAKIQRARSKMDRNNQFRNQTRALAATFVRSAEDLKSPYVYGNGSKTAAVLAIAADRGLCGGYNINAGRAAVDLVKKLENAKLVTVGIKAKDYCRRRVDREIAHSFTGVSENPFFEDAEEIANLLLDWYRSDEIGDIYMIYTEFQNMLSQEVKTVKLLPLDTVERAEEGIRVNGIEPESEAFIERMIPFYLASSIYSALLESSCCEQSARVSSMDSAVKNSDEMIANLTLQYNRVRQGRITQEIIEITGGADAVQ